MPARPIDYGDWRSVLAAAADPGRSGLVTWDQIVSAKQARNSERRSEEQAEQDRRRQEQEERDRLDEEQAADDSVPEAGNVWGPAGVDPMPNAMAGLTQAATEGFLQGGPGAMQRGLGQRTPPPLARALKGLGRLF